MEMKTLEHYKKVWLDLTTGQRPYCGLPNGTTLNAVKQVMKEFGYYRPQLDKMGIMADIKEDMENGYIKKRVFQNWYATMCNQTELYVLTVKGSKVLYENLTA